MTMTSIYDKDINDLRSDQVIADELPYRETASIPAAAFKGPFLEMPDVVALAGVAVMTLGPLAALPLGF